MEPNTNRPINDANEISRWNYFQKCIHGFKSQPANEMHASTRVEITDGSTEDVTSTKQRLSKRQRDSGSADGAAASNRSERENGVVIKHFTTNRILLKHQKFYLDRDFCLFIIPVMTIDEVKDWNGSSYTGMGSATPQLF